MYAGKRTLVTGGTGSFGQTMVRRMLAADVAEVRVLSRDEGKHDQMRVELADPRVRFYVGDVRDYLSVERACRDVDMVFHAAALKQVPSCEFFPVEAVRTNVMGSDNVARACEANGVPSLVFLSTDKAVYPINAMGMTKAMMEPHPAVLPRQPVAATHAIADGRHGRAAALAAGLAVSTTVGLVAMRAIAGATGGALATLFGEAGVSAALFGLWLSRRALERDGSGV